MGGGRPGGLWRDASGGGVGQPVCRGLVQVLQRSKGTAVEQVLFQIGKRPLHLPFRFRTMRAASPWLKAIVRGERQKASVVDRLGSVITGHLKFHGVVQAGGPPAPSLI